MTLRTRQLRGDATVDWKLVRARLEATRDAAHSSKQTHAALFEHVGMHTPCAAQRDVV